MGDLAGFVTKTGTSQVPHRDRIRKVPLRDSHGDLRYHVPPWLFVAFLISELVALNKYQLDGDGIGLVDRRDVAGPRGVY